MTIAIAFASGCYGTYLEWCLTALTSDLKLSSPFTETGSSHRFYGNHLINMGGWNEYYQSSKNLNFVRLHPKTKQQEILYNSLKQLSNQANYVIHIYPTESTNLLCLNNYFSKVWNDWWDKNFKSDINPDKIYSNWNIDPNVPVTQIPNWIKREFLSFYLLPSWQEIIGYHDQPNWLQTNCIHVAVNDLLYNFESTIEQIRTRCNLTFTKPVTDLLPYHQINLKNQKYINHDTFCKNVVDSTINNLNASWTDLGLCSESWIQWELRNRGFEIQCDGLDIFPTNSLHLKELLYPI